MPLFGAHMSIAGGLHKAIESAREYGFDTFQMFTASPSQWKGKPITDEDVETFKTKLRETKIQFPTAHDSYLINLASPDPALYRRSIEAFVDELERAERLGLSYLVTHPGAHVGSGEAAGIERVAEAIDEVHRRCPGYKVQILLEATAGQGTTLGHRFEHLGEIIGRVSDDERVGVCVDTCHIFAAGYSLAPEPYYRETFDEFNRLVGLEWLKLFHLNDSKKPLGSRVDRHEALGKGHLGLEPFRLIVNDPRFQRLPMILETPKKSEDNPDMDAVNLAILRGLID